MHVITAVAVGLFVIALEHSLSPMLFISARLVYFLRVNFLVKTSTSGRRDQIPCYHGNDTAVNLNMAVFVHPPGNLPTQKN